MKNVILGTAGHIDHGKTTLIKALTGRETDNLKEEKQRGISINLGFTYFDLPSKKRVGIVDVPGHEKFIKNMLAGACGIDIVLLVIAADEGVILKIPTNSRGNLSAPSSRHYIKTYIVQSGDTLTSIAKKFNTTADKIALLNNITNPNLIYPGQILKIETSINSSTRGYNFNTMYTVQKGDTLLGISRKLDVDYKELIQKNDITNPNLIYTGEVLKI